MRNQTAIHMLMNLLFPIVMPGQLFLIADVMKLSDAFYGPEAQASLVSRSITETIDP